MITSYKNPRIKLVRDLLDSKKQRESAGLMVLEGVRLAEEAIRHKIEVQHCFFSANLSNRGQALLDHVKKLNTQVDELSQDLMDRLSDTQHAQGILLVCKIPELPFRNDPLFLLALDRINDPGNMGTILRTAAAMKADGILLTTGTTDPFSPKALRAAMGAQLHLPIQWKDGIGIKKICTSYKAPLELVATIMDCAQDCWEADLTTPICLVIGNEANGINRELLALCGRCVRIPITEHTESLNAAIAAAILMYEITRQRKKK